MATYLIHWPLWRDLLPLPVFAALVSIMLTFILAQEKKTKENKLFWQSFIVLFSMALLGIVTGQLTGQSREPVVGAVVPAVLSLIGGITVYLLAAKSERQQLIVALVMVAFSFNLLVGAFWGARLRYDFEDYRNSEKYKLSLELTEQNVRLQKLLYEKQLQDVRERIGLESAPSGKK